MAKLTFSLDDETVGRLKRVAAQLRKPQSQVVREAVAEYAARADRLSDGEREKLLQTLGAIVARPATRSAREVEAEIQSVWVARRAGGRRTAR